MNIIPVHNTGEDCLFQKLAGFQPLDIGLQLIAPGRFRDVFGVGAVPARARICPDDSRSDPFPVVTEDHCQGDCSAFQILKLHNDRHLRDLILPGNRDRASIFHI